MIIEQYDEIIDDLDYIKEHEKINLGTYVKLDDVLKVINEVQDVWYSSIAHMTNYECFNSACNRIYRKVLELKDCDE